MLPDAKESYWVELDLGSPSLLFLSRGGILLGRRGAQQLTGHAARAVISTERRVQIWDQFYISFKETIPHYQWCTRQELVKAACSGKTGIKFTVDELTEVIRGRKHKREAGVDSQKVDGEWLYRCEQVCGKKAE